MYSDETTEGDNDNSGPAPKKIAVARSSSEMSDQMTRLSGNGERRASAMSAQVSLPDDAGSGSVRGSITGSATGYATPLWCPCHFLRCHKFTDVTSCLANKINNTADNCMPSRAKKTTMDTHKTSLVVLSFFIWYLSLGNELQAGSS